MLASTPRHRMRTDGDSDDTLWLNEHKLTVHMGAFCISKGGKAAGGDSPVDSCSCGEDSCCFGVAKDSVFLGVADGVGGSRRKGGNPALFAQTLLNKSLEAAQSRRFDEEQVARNIVNEAFTKLVEDFVRRPVVPFGSSTICVALIDPVCGKLKFANVGDSGLIVLRHVALGGGYKIEFRTRSLQYSFNAPHCLVLTSDLKQVNPTDSCDTEESFEESRNFYLKDADIVLLVTDGVLDNLFLSEIEQVVNSTILDSSPDLAGSARHIAKNISFKAREASLDQARNCPFNASELEKTGKRRVGGKKDDITVLVAIIE